MPHRPHQLGLWRGLLVLGFALLLFGYAGFSGKPMSMHEARLPQVAREMQIDGRWLMPMNGERPWLERPPLPHWLLRGIGLVAGDLDREWVVRLPTAICGALTCLLLALLVTRLFDRDLGCVSGLVLATTYEFYLYASSAEEEVMLAMLVCGAVWMFASALEARRRVAIGSGTNAQAIDGRSKIRRWTGAMPRSVWVWWAAFFVTLGLMNLVRGPGVGMVQTLSGIGVLLLVRAVMLRRLGELFAPFGFLGWIAGLLVSLAIGAWWYVWAGIREPSLAENLLYDFQSGFSADPWWYYGPTILWTCLPWAPWAIYALVKSDRSTRLRGGLLVMCAVVPVLVMSVPERKHHHYLVPVLWAWAGLAAIGLRMGWRLAGGWRVRARGGWIVGAVMMLAVTLAAGLGKLPGGWTSAGLLGPVLLLSAGVVGWGFATRRAWAGLGGVLIGFLVAASWFQSTYYTSTARRTAERDFAQRADAIVPKDATLGIVAGSALDFFVHQFYTRPEAVVLHNLSWLRDERLPRDVIYVITRARDEAWIDTEIGPAEKLLESQPTRRGNDPGNWWVLLRIEPRPDLIRHAPQKIDVLQGLRRPANWRDYRGADSGEPADYAPFLGEPAPQEMGRVSGER